MPIGVHGANADLSYDNSPTLYGVRPSTSFSGDMRDVIEKSLMFSGSGSCTSMPCTIESEFNSSTSFSSSSFVVDDGNLWSLVVMPTSEHARCLLCTYVAEAASSPTSTVARHGSTPSFFRWVTAFFTDSFTFFATITPSSFMPLTPHWVFFSF